MLFDKWFPDNISTFGGEIDSTFYLIFYIVGFWFLLTEGAIIYFAFRYRRRKGYQASHLRGETLKQTAWILIPGLIVFLLDLGIDFAGGHAYNKVKFDKPPSDTKVQVMAKQFDWIYTYPGPDKEFGTEDDMKLEPGDKNHGLHVPINRVVTVILQSEDVIHSFFVPVLRLKQDIIPGREIPVWFEATKEGNYEIACAELCGFSHHSMRSILFVHSEDGYTKWEEKQRLADEAF